MQWEVLVDITLKKGCRDAWRDEQKFMKGERIALLSADECIAKIWRQSRRSYSKRTDDLESRA